jgi:hypothetical protein
MGGFLGFNVLWRGAVRTWGVLNHRFPTCSNERLISTGLLFVKIRAIVGGEKSGCEFSVG